MFQCTVKNYLMPKLWKIIVAKIKLYKKRINGLTWINHNSPSSHWQKMDLILCFVVWACATANFASTDRLKFSIAKQLNFFLKAAPVTSTTVKLNLKNISGQEMSTPTIFPELFPEDLSTDLHYLHTVRDYPYKTEYDSGFEVSSFETNNSKQYVPKSEPQTVS